MKENRQINENKNDQKIIENKKNAYKSQNEPENRNFFYKAKKPHTHTHAPTNLRERKLRN